MAVKRANLLNPFWRVLYWYISRLDKKGEVTFLNYGYADDKNIKLNKEDETNRYPLQLYHHVTASIDLKDLDVLEVGCGRGGGASYVARYLYPKSVEGIDICRKAVDFCQKNHSLNNLSFRAGNALHLPCEDSSVDVVINVESSHRYPSMEKFLSEVYRVLKHGGYFLFADLRYAESVEDLRKQFKNSKLKLIKEELITENVLKALHLDHERRLDLIKRLTLRPLHKFIKEFAGTKGTDLYKDLSTGKKEYLHYVLQKV